MHRSDPSFPAVDVEPASTTAGADVHDGADLPVLFFDLGDRDLTTDEVRGAIETVVERRDELGLPSDRPFGDLVAASYANVDEPSCFLYDHPDHLAVSDVVLHTDFEAFASQLVPVCSAAHDAAEHHRLDRATFDAAFAVDGERRIGAHTVEYGWLLDPYWVGDPSGQAQLFHRDQWFLRAFH